MDALRKLVADYWLVVHPKFRKIIVFTFTGLVVLVIALASLQSPQQSVSVSGFNSGGSSLSSGSTGNSEELGVPAQTLDGVIYVHVAGAVKHPGVYELAAGSRVLDLIAAASGFSNNSAEATVNLARVLSDGEQVIVGVSQQAGVETSAAPKVNINQASAAEIETLAGIGPTLAARIIDYRLANGLFKSLNDLGKVAGIGPKLLARITPQVTL